MQAAARIEARAVERAPHHRTPRRFSLHRDTAKRQAPSMIQRSRRDAPAQYHPQRRQRVHATGLEWGRVRCVYSERAVTVPSPDYRVCRVTRGNVHRQSFHFDTEDTGPAYTQVQIQHRSRAQFTLNATLTASLHNVPPKPDMGPGGEGWGPAFPELDWKIFARTHELKGVRASTGTLKRLPALAFFRVPRIMH